MVLCKIWCFNKGDEWMVVGTSGYWYANVVYKGESSNVKIGFQTFGVNTLK